MQTKPLKAYSYDEDEENFVAYENSVNFVKFKSWSSETYREFFLILIVLYVYVYYFYLTRINIALYACNTIYFTRNNVFMYVAIVVCI